MKSALLVLAAALLWSAPDSPVFAANPAVALRPIRGAVIIKRSDSAWESQQVQEPCILPNPKDPARLVMFYSGVPATNRDVCFVGKAWALHSAQACPLPANSNDTDGQWDLWCIACDRLIPTLPGCESIYIPGKPAAAEAVR